MERGEISDADILQDLLMLPEGVKEVPTYVNIY